MSTSYQRIISIFAIDNKRVKIGGIENDYCKTYDFDSYDNCDICLDFFRTWAKTNPE